MKRYHQSIAVHNFDTEDRDGLTETFQQSVGSCLTVGWQLLNDGREAIENYIDPIDRLTKDGVVLDRPSD